jgi:hypothetical protein
MRLPCGPPRARHGLDDSWEAPHRAKWTQAPSTGVRCGRLPLTGSAQRLHWLSGYRRYQPPHWSMALARRLLTFRSDQTRWERVLGLVFNRARPSEWRPAGTPTERETVPQDALHRHAHSPRLRPPLQESPAQPGRAPRIVVAALRHGHDSRLKWSRPRNNEEVEYPEWLVLLVVSNDEVRQSV